MVNGYYSKRKLVSGKVKFPLALTIVLCKSYREGLRLSANAFERKCLPDIGAEQQGDYFLCHPLSPRYVFKTTTDCVALLESGEKHFGGIRK